MNATALSLVLVAAVVHAVWNLAAKRISSGGTQFVWLYYTVSAVVLLPVTVVLLAVGPQRPQWSWLLAAAGTSVLHVAYGIVLQRGYRAGDLSVVYPVARGTGPLLSVLAAVFVLGERPGWLGLLGAFLVIAGVLVISTGRTGSGTHAVKAGVFYGLLTGAVIAGYTLWDAHSVTGVGVPPVVYFGLGSVLQSVMLVPGALAGRAEVARIWREQRREVLLVALLSPLAYILVLFALTMAPVSLVAPARELSIVLGGLAAWLVLGERDAVRRLAGAVIVLSGIVAIAAA
ncbi:EamA family transporter [Amycolatopsis balhimycina DSM 5908]|uniref:EamA family transporter n=1 Tax=Amycolatopsis balhimycina DSM 5908 TaxID=1081091 RepID=A0A428W5G8_AMYBA|nr:DMT family transporter [Amycolatopsis balhimycina]RSM38329.1 EamA family transporter [Amycolatopsis balhimycina DSM 5908]